MALVERLGEITEALVQFPKPARLTDFYPPFVR